MQYIATARSVRLQFHFSDRTLVCNVLRTNSVTSGKALYVDSNVARYTVDFKKEESKHLLKFLYDLMAFSRAVQCRVRWRPGFGAGQPCYCSFAIDGVTDWS